MSVLTAVIVASLIGMQIYMKRAVMGRWRTAADSIGEQYEPRKTSAHFTQVTRGTTETSTTLDPNRQVDVDNDGVTEPVDVTVTTGKIRPDDPETVIRTGNQTVEKLGTSLWE